MDIDATGYSINHDNTGDTLKAEITTQTIELEQKKFTLALLKNDEKNYEELVKSLEAQTKSKIQNLKSIQQRVFVNRIIFSDQLISFALRDSTVGSVDEEVVEHTAGSSNGCNRLDEISNADYGEEWKIKVSEFTLRDEDDTIFEEIQFHDNHESGDRKVKFRFKQPTLTK